MDWLVVWLVGWTVGARLLHGVAGGARRPQDSLKLVQEGPKTAQDAQDSPKTAHEAPKPVPRWPRTAQEARKTAQNGPKTAQDSPRGSNPFRNLASLSRSSSFQQPLPLIRSVPPPSPPHTSTRRILIRRRVHDRHRLRRPRIMKPILATISIVMETEHIRLVKEQLALCVMRAIEVTVRERDGVTNACVTAAHDHNERLGDCCERGPIRSLARVAFHRRSPPDPVGTEKVLLPWRPPAP